MAKINNAATLTWHAPPHPLPPILKKLEPKQFRD